MRRHNIIIRLVRQNNFGCIYTMSDDVYAIYIVLIRATFMQFVATFTKIALIFSPNKRDKEVTSSSIWTDSHRGFEVSNITPNFPEAPPLFLISHAPQHDLAFYKSKRRKCFEFINLR